MAIFKPSQCHHRDGSGKPDCAKKQFKASSAYCQTHEAQYQSGEYRAPWAATMRASRSAANRPSKPARKRRDDRRSSGGTASSRSSRVSPRSRRSPSASPA